MLSNSVYCLKNARPFQLVVNSFSTCEKLLHNIYIIITDEKAPFSHLTV